MRESFPARGTSGHVAVLTLTLEHGKGEQVLPGGVQVNADSDEGRALKREHFVLPDPNGSAAPSIKRTDAGTRAKTVVKIPFVPLPPKAGRYRLELPSLPISISRASGQVITLCTKPHAITVEDPAANVPDPKPHPNPPPRRQRETWELLKQAVFTGLIALVVGALLALLIVKWRRRPRRLPPPPPPRPPWEVALEELFDVRNAGLVAAGRYAEHFDRVSDTIRKYLGDRYGFEGLESTTREALSVLRARKPAIAQLDQIATFMRSADLVKFARLTPSAEECELILSRGENIVRATMPNGSLPASEASDQAPNDATPPDHDGTPDPNDTSTDNVSEPARSPWAPPEPLETSTASAPARSPWAPPEPPETPPASEAAAPEEARDGVATKQSNPPAPHTDETPERDPQGGDA